MFIKMHCVHNLFVLSCVLLTVTVVKGLEMDDGDSELTENCMTQHGVTIEEVKRMFAEQGIPTNDKEECFFACVLKKRNLMTDDNLLNVEHIKLKLQPIKKINPEGYDEIVAVIEETYEETKNMPGVADECKAAANIAKVLTPKMKELKKNMEE